MAFAFADPTKDVAEDEFTQALKGVKRLEVDHARQR
jgi:hypothetical protein